MLELNKVILGYNKKKCFINLDENLNLCPVKEKPLMLTLEDIHTQLKTLRFNIFYQSVGGLDNKISTFENAGLIPFNFMYYYLFISEQKIPTPQKLLCEYVRNFCEKSNIPHYYKFKKEYIEAGYFADLFTLETLGARMCRAYNSFNREVELAFRLRQEDILSIRYSFKEDYYKGIDLSIIYNNQYYGVACYQNNNRTNHYKKLKETVRRSNYDTEHIFPMAINAYNHDTCGEIWLFSNKEYNDLKHKIMTKGEKEYVF